MPDPISLASGLVALAGFAFQCSIGLHKTVQSFRNHPTRVRDLCKELEALSGVLGLLTETVSATVDVDLSALNLPLLRCGHACREFEQEIIKCSSRSGATRTSFRDWAKLRYMGDDISEFRQLLAGYKSTVNIALTDANLRKSHITAESLESYKDLLQTATVDLEAHLESIDEKLENILARTITESGSSTADLRLMQEERRSAQNCLQICAQLSEHIDQIRLTTEPGSSSGAYGHTGTLPERVVTEGLQECKDSLVLTTAKLEKFMLDRIDRLVTQSKAAMTSEEDRAELGRLREEWNTARQSMDIYSKANIYLKENVSNIENYATGDAVQFMVSTDGTTLHGKNRGLGWRTRQVGGHMSDLSVQQLSRDMTSTGIRNNRGEESSQSIPDDEAENKLDSEFRDRWGKGFDLRPKNTADRPKNSVS